MIAVIGGTGLNSFVGGERCATVETPYGDVSADIIRASVSEKSVYFLARHGSPHVIPPHKINYRANLWALKQLGVSQLIAVNAVGGIHAEMQAGVLVLPDQIIDYSYGREHSFYDGSSTTLDHVDFTYPFNQRLRELLLAAAADTGTKLVAQAVYGVTQGPRLETAAEIDRMERDGCDIVGMTAMPEAALARELDIDYASVCLVVNPAAGRSDGLITMADIQAVVDSGMATVRQLLQASISRL
jgi:5'-methylthioinosine phosphorylase